MNGSAVFSEETPPRFRWRLDRWWADGYRALICMTNPSMAGAEKNDPTITQNNKLFKALGYPGYTAVNWAPFIATDPADLHAWCWNSPLERILINEKNLDLVRELSESAPVRVVAWGGLVISGPHTTAMLNALSLDGKHPLYAFALTKDGHPRHPMARGKHRIPVGQELTVWKQAA